MRQESNAGRGGEPIHNMGQEKASCGLVVKKRSYWARAWYSPVEGGLSVVLSSCSLVPHGVLCKILSPTDGGLQVTSSPACTVHAPRCQHAHCLHHAVAVGMYGPVPSCSASCSGKLWRRRVSSCNSLPAHAATAFSWARLSGGDPFLTAAAQCRSPPVACPQRQALVRTATHWYHGSASMVGERTLDCGGLVSSGRLPNSHKPTIRCYRPPPSPVAALLQPPNH